MNRRSLVVFFPAVIMLGVILLSILGLQTVGASDARILSNQTDPQTSIPTSSSTPLPSSTPTATLNVPPTALSFEKASLYTPQKPELLAFIEAPQGPQTSPYVIIKAHDSYPGTLTIEFRGKVGTIEFACAGPICQLPIERDSIVSFRAYSDIGVTSELVEATVRVDNLADGYYLSVDLLRPIVIFTDTCSNVWDAGYGIMPSWAQYRQVPNQLHTNKTLHYLAGKLITNDIVDADDCPGMGMTGGAPNACGLDRAAEAMALWQNQYDFNIWLASRDVGIPPVLLKTLFEYETQFWPQSARYFMDEFGLGQINDLGVDVLLRWNLDVFQNVCRSSLLDCSKPYTKLSPFRRAMLRGVVLNSLDADCPNCAYGLNIEKAQQSVRTIALILQANCNDTGFLVRKITYPLTYEDYWKFTMVSYHSGYGCLENAMTIVASLQEPMNWENMSSKLDCPGAKEYVDELWALLYTFDDYLVKPTQQVTVPAIPTFVPTVTPIPSPTPNISNAKVRVQVFLDKNGSGTPEQDEWLDNITVQLNIAYELDLFETTVDGQAFFDLSGYPVGVPITISLPGLYRSYGFSLPESGEVLVIFKFEEPELPPVLP